MTRYAVIIPRTRLTLETSDLLDRAKSLAAFHWRRLQHPVYPPEVVVERIGPDGKRRRVWNADQTVSA